MEILVLRSQITGQLQFIPCNDNGEKDLIFKKIYDEYPEYEKWDTIKK